MPRAPTSREHVIAIVPRGKGRRPRRAFLRSVGFREYFDDIPNVKLTETDDGFGPPYRRAETRAFQAGKILRTITSMPSRN